MRILITAYNVSGTAAGGGSSRLMQAIAGTLNEHEVTLSCWPLAGGKDDYDLIICSHYMEEVGFYNAYKIFISHGIVPAEAFHQGGDRYISISEEVRNWWFYTGINSEIIAQPIIIRERGVPNDELKNILVIRREQREPDLFMFLASKYNLRYSNMGIPIEDQIKWADLCITLGRGALESMAQGKPVLVADNRSYIGAYGDGYVTKDNISEIAKCNFSGRRFKFPITKEWITGELEKYNADDSCFLHSYVKENHEARKIAKEILNGINYYPGIRPDINDNGMHRSNQSEYAGL